MMSSPFDTPDRRGVVGRKLVGKPVLWQDWDEEVLEGAARYWELFTDLLLVAAASSVAEGFEENQNVRGFLEFSLLYIIIINGWLLYTHHYTARFEESSLLHSFTLFFFLLGMAASIVNATLETAREFALSIALQRGAFMGMIVPVGIYLKRARAFATVLSLLTVFSMILFLAVAAVTRLELNWLLYVWVFASVFEFCGYELVMVTTLRGPTLVPINIEHTKDRLGALVLVMLGETVISCTMTYREHAGDSTADENMHYYRVLALSFLLIFMFTLLFFNMQPAPKDHAFRRSRLIAVLLLLLHKLLGLSLLMIGVCIKLAVHAVVKSEPYSAFTASVLKLSLGTSLLFLFGMRLCHYGGKLPRVDDPNGAKLLMWIWWAVFATATVLPFVVPCPQDPIWALSMYSGLLLVLCVVESSFTHVLQHHLPNEVSMPLYSERPTYTPLDSLERPVIR